jgi:hypothetical protein
LTPSSDAYRDAVQKSCPRCGVEKSVDGGFYVLSDGRVSGWCRECVKADKRARYASRPEVRQRAIEQAKAYREQHREELAVAQREWERQNEERRRKQRRARDGRGERARGTP